MHLRAYQLSALHAIERSRVRSVLAVAPTGAGKGTIAVELLRRSVERGERSLFVVHRREIVFDIFDRLAAVGVQAGIVLNGIAPNPHARVQVASVQTLLATTPVAGAYDLVVADEAHHYAAPEWGQVVGATQARKVVGFTATPQRSDGRALGDCFDELIEVARYSELLRDGYIVPCRVLRPSHPLERALAQNPAGAYLRYARGSSCFLYVSDARGARSTRAQLRRGGVTAEIVDHTTHADVRATALERLASGALQVVINHYTMTEGVDVPNVSTIVLARACLGVASYLQIVGRALRPSPGKQEALLLDLTGASFAHGFPTIDRAYSLEGARPISFGGDDVRDYNRLRLEPSALEELDLDLVEATHAQQMKYGRRIVDWNGVPFGQKSDNALAKELGLSLAMVNAERRRRQIAPFRVRRYEIDWRGVPLGKKSDAEIALQLGVSRQVVSAERKRREQRREKFRAAQTARTPKPPDWSRLGQVPDAQFAYFYALPVDVVTAERERRGVRKYRRHG